MEVQERNIRKFKGNNLLEMPASYVVLDIETAGYTPGGDHITEVGAIKVRDGKIIDTYSQLINPREPLPYFITRLTGITNEMVAHKPIFAEIAKECYAFLENEIIVGHNVHFDINFMYDNFIKNDIHLKNDFVDLLRISRRLSPHLKNHKLGTVASSLGVSYEGAHRALEDSKITYACFEKYRQKIIEEGIQLKGPILKRNSTVFSARSIVGDSSKWNADHIFYQKTCCFTGTLDQMPRKEAMQIVSDIGGYCEDRITQNTDYLIVGNFSYKKSVLGNKSSKIKQAEQYILEGQSIKVISEREFYEMIEM